jgi:hypothetical protein
MLDADPVPVATPDRSRSRRTSSPRGYRRVVLGAAVAIAATWFRSGLVDAPGTPRAPRQEPFGGATI